MKNTEGCWIFFHKWFAPGGSQLKICVCACFFSPTLKVIWWRPFRWNATRRDNQGCFLDFFVSVKVLIIDFFWVVFIYLLTFKWKATSGHSCAPSSFLHRSTVVWNEPRLQDNHSSFHIFASFLVFWQWNKNCLWPKDLWGKVSKRQFSCYVLPDKSTDFMQNQWDSVFVH